MLFAIVLAATLNSSDPADFVRTLYVNAAASAPDPVYSVTSRAKLMDTFEGPIVDLIWRDLIDAQGEVGRMDAHYLFDAQDSDVEDLQIKTLENKGGRARVLATVAKRSAEFHLRKTAGGWRISNIVYAGGKSYMDILKADFPVPRIEDEDAQLRLCTMYADYDVAVPEGWDEKGDARDLAEMFANGTEVKQDFGAAIHLLCNEESNLADAERWGMLGHILEMERGVTDEPLDFCDHSTSRYGGIICASRRADRLEPELESRYEAVRKNAGESLDALRKAADAFIEADANWETEQYRGGTMYAYAGTHAELDRRQKFVELLEELSQKRAADADFKRADADLNAAYRRRVSKIEPCDPEYESCGGPTEKENLKAAQRVWIVYRDAWIAYYRERWRGAASPDALRNEIAARITRERIKELETE